MDSLNKFTWSDKNEFLLLDENDIAYLNLSKDDLRKTTEEFDKLFFYNPTSTLKSVIDYCYQNWVFAAKLILGVDLLPFQGVTIDNFFNKIFFILVATRGYGKSFLFAVYALLKAIFFQGSKIVIVSASFRQSKFVFDYVTNIYQRSRVLQQICFGSKPRIDISMCRFKIGQSEIISIPLGDGSRIRGLRASDILADEFDSINEEIFQVS